MLETTVQHNERRREALQRDIDRFLDEGKMIEVLTPTPGDESVHRRQSNYHAYFNVRDK
jgi:hypothetical protein